MTIKELEEIYNKRCEEDSPAIILYNDDVNTFDHVINCLIQFVDHNSIQAEQCALLVHNKGKCSIKKGDISDLIPIKSKLLMHKLNVEIEYG